MMQEDRHVTDPNYSDDSYTYLEIIHTYDNYGFSQYKYNCDSEDATNLDFNMDDINSWIEDTYDENWELIHVGDIMGSGYVRALCNDGTETRLYFREQTIRI